MFEFLKDSHKTEPVCDLADQLQHSGECNWGLKKAILPGFENWLMEYRSRLAKLIQEETKDTNGG
jgi:hypothetical protein